MSAPHVNLTRQLADTFIAQWTPSCYLVTIDWYSRTRESPTMDSAEAIPDPDEKRWHVKIGGKKLGPFSDDEMGQLAATPPSTQDFKLSRTEPMVEIFDDSLEICDPNRMCEQTREHSAASRSEEPNLQLDDTLLLIEPESS